MIHVEFRLYTKIIQETVMLLLGCFTYIFIYIYTSASYNSHHFYELPRFASFVM